MARQFWLVKSETEDYPFEQFKKDKQTGWTGVRNYQARNFMRDGMKLGDRVLFYETDTAAVVGIAEVARESHPDPTQFDPQSDYYDEKAAKDKPTWMMVDLKFVGEFKHPVTRDELKKTKALEKMALFRQGRLSVVPVTAEEFEIIVGMGKTAR